jgi:hypothetical protein
LLSALCVYTNDGYSLVLDALSSYKVEIWRHVLVIMMRVLSVRLSLKNGLRSVCTM